MCEELAESVAQIEQSLRFLTFMVIAYLVWRFVFADRMW